MALEKAQHNGRRRRLENGGRSAADCRRGIEEWMLSSQARHDNTRQELDQFGDTTFPPLRFQVALHLSHLHGRRRKRRRRNSRRRGGTFLLLSLDCRITNKGPVQLSSVRFSAVLQSTTNVFPTVCHAPILNSVYADESSVFQYFSVLLSAVHANWNWTIANRRFTERDSEEDQQD